MKVVGDDALLFTTEVGACWEIGRFAIGMRGFVLIG